MKLNDVIQMDPEYIYGTVPAEEGPWPIVAGAVLIAGGLLYAVLSGGKRRRRR